MKTEYRPTKSISEVIDEVREEFKKTYGRLLTEEEAIKLTEEIKAAIRYERDICRTQERIFKYAAEHNYNMEDFSKTLMESDITNKDMDGEYSTLCCSTAEEIIYELGNPEFEYEKNDDDIERAGWIGYIYRLLQIESQYSSGEIYRVLPYHKMKDIWIGGHTMGCTEVVTDLIEIIKQSGNQP